MRASFWELSVHFISRLQLCFLTVGSRCTQGLTTCLWLAWASLRRPSASVTKSRPTWLLYRVKRRIHGFNLSFFKSYVDSECWPRYFKVTDTKYYFLKMNSHFWIKWWTVQWQSTRVHNHFIISTYHLVALSSPLPSPFPVFFLRFHRKENTHHPLQAGVLCLTRVIISAHPFSCKWPDSILLGSRVTALAIHTRFLFPLTCWGTLTPFLGISNRGGTSTDAQRSFAVCWLGFLPGGAMAKSYGSSISSFWRNINTHLHMTVLIYIPNNST